MHLRQNWYLAWADPHPVGTVHYRTSPFLPPHEGSFMLIHWLLELLTCLKWLQANVNVLCHMMSMDGTPSFAKRDRP